jgi:hypothetical protein
MLLAAALPQENVASRPSHAEGALHVEGGEGLALEGFSTFREVQNGERVAQVRHRAVEAVPQRVVDPFLQEHHPGVFILSLHDVLVIIMQFQELCQAGIVRGFRVEGVGEGGFALTRDGGQKDDHQDRRHVFYVSGEPRAFH